MNNQELNINEINKIVTNAVNDYNSNKLFTSLDRKLEQFKAIDIAEQKAELYFSTYEKSAIKLIKKSPLAGEILNYADKITETGLTIQQAINILAFIHNILKYQKVEENTWITIPDRLICKRFKINRRDLNRLMFILRRTNLLEVKTIQNKLNICLNTAYYENDKYFLRKAKTQYRTDIKHLTTMLENIESLMYSEYSAQTILNERATMTLGVIVAGIFVNNNSLNSEKRNQDLATYGIRSDIIYGQIPYNALYKLFKVKENDKTQFNHYISNHIKGGKYLSRRTKTYQSKVYDSSYYNENYKRDQLVDFRKAKQDDDRLYIDENSIILHVGQLTKTAKGRYIIDNLPMFIKLYLKLENNEEIDYFELVNWDIFAENEEMQKYIASLQQIAIKQEETATKNKENKDENNTDIETKTKVYETTLVDEFGNALYYEDNNNSYIEDFSKLMKWKLRQTWFGKKYYFYENNSTIESAIKALNRIKIQLEQFPFMSRNQENYNHWLMEKIRKFLHDKYMWFKERQLELPKILKAALESSYADWILAC